MKMKKTKKVGKKRSRECRGVERKGEPGSRDDGEASKMARFKPELVEKSISDFGKINL
jgi:hypothetical protein